MYFYITRKRVYKFFEKKTFFEKRVHILLSKEKERSGVYMIETPKQIKYPSFSFLTTEHILLHPQKKTEHI